MPRPAVTLRPDDVRTIDLCGGPGGWEEGARILGGRDLLDQLAIHGIEINRDAAATARAAGHHRHDTNPGATGDITTADPTNYPNATGLIASTPCPSFSRSGKRTGVGDDDYQAALDAITCYSEGCGCEYGDLAHRVTDPRTALVVEVARWTFGLESLEWVALEQVPDVEYIWEDFAAELYAAGWEYVNVVSFDAVDLGAGARRPRVFLLAHKYRPCAPVHFDGAGPVLPPRSMAEHLGWESGDKVRTRGNRRATGGNLFSSDRPSWCLTGKARTWTRESNGGRLTAAEAGWLQGFPLDYPWQGSRTSQFQQAADVVCPPAAAVILGAIHRLDWRAALARWGEERTGAPSPTARQAAELIGALF